MERFLMSQQAVNKSHGNQKHHTKKLNGHITWERYPQTHVTVWVAHIRLRVRPGDGFSVKRYWPFCSIKDIKLASTSSIRSTLLCDLFEYVLLHTVHILYNAYIINQTHAALHKNSLRYKLHFLQKQPSLKHKHTPCFKSVLQRHRRIYYTYHCNNQCVRKDG
jgi:hypothetical protein